MGVYNIYRLKPILNARIPINSTFTTLIKLHNPTNRSLQVTEVYTSDDDLHLELPPIGGFNDDNEYSLNHGWLDKDKNQNRNNNQPKNHKRLDMSNKTKQFWV